MEYNEDGMYVRGSVPEFLQRQLYDIVDGRHLEGGHLDGTQGLNLDLEVTIPLDVDGTSTSSSSSSSNNSSSSNSGGLTDQDSGSDSEFVFKRGGGGGGGGRKREKGVERGGYNYDHVVDWEGIGRGRHSALRSLEGGNMSVSVSSIPPVSSVSVPVSPLAKQQQQKQQQQEYEYEYSAEELQEMREMGLDASGLLDYDYDFDYE